MVDWIVDLKNKIISYIPNKPPSPLFKSVTCLEANIQSRVGDSALVDNDNENHDDCRESVKLMAYEGKNSSDETLDEDNKVSSVY